MGLGATVQGAIARATPFSEGRWLSIPVESERDEDEVQALVALRARDRWLG